MLAVTHHAMVLHYQVRPGYSFITSLVHPPLLFTQGTEHYTRCGAEVDGSQLTAVMSAHVLAGEPIRQALSGPSERIQPVVVNRCRC